MSGSARGCWILQSSHHWRDVEPALDEGKYPLMVYNESPVVEDWFIITSTIITMTSQDRCVPYEDIVISELILGNSPKVDFGLTLDKIGTT